MPASVAQRLYALTLDTLIQIGAAIIAPFFGIQGTAYAIVLTALMVLYEPVLVSWQGATLGHRLMKIRVQTTEKKKPGFGLAFLRFFIKNTLGIFSIITLISRQQTIHDILTKTSVCQSR